MSEFKEIFEEMIKKEPFSPLKQSSSPVVKIDIFDGKKKAIYEDDAEEDFSCTPVENEREKFLRNILMKGVQNTNLEGFNFKLIKL